MLDVHPTCVGKTIIASDGYGNEACAAQLITHFIAA